MAIIIARRTATMSSSQLILTIVKISLKIVNHGNTNILIFYIDKAILNNYQVNN